MDDDEAFLLLLLSDGNLPTGSFVASSGLEAYVKHGFSSLPYLSGTSTSMGHATALPLPLQSGATINFIRDGVQTYARSSLPFLSAVYQACDTLARSSNPLEYLPAIFRQIRELDDLYEAATMNHVARRASTSQGVALLTLLLKGLARPAWAISIDGEEAAHAKQIEELAGMFKSEIRRGSTPGHLPLCWAMLTSALGLSCERSKYLFIFLYARSLLSASIRLNTIGPYAAQQLLLYIIRPLIHSSLEDTKSVGIHFSTRDNKGGNEDREIDDELEGPAVTWPLGEILAARHDLQHSRIFNS